MIAMLEVDIMRFKVVCLLVFIFLVTILGCSERGDITAPNPVTPLDAREGHQLWAALDFSWDGVSDELVIAPNRTLGFHINVTDFFIPDHINMTIVSWDPDTMIMVIKVILDNPFEVDGFDVRGIVTGLGDGELLNADDYTKLFDLSEPPIANPFRAFAKDEPNRTFWNKNAMPHQYIKTEFYELHFVPPIKAALLIEASWPENCPEPYDIVSIDVTGEIIETEGSLDVIIEVLDWQDVTAADVIIEANPITGGDVHLIQIDETHWQTTIYNTGGVVTGDYDVWVAAWDTAASDALYNTFTIEIGSDLPEFDDPILVSGEPGVDEILPRIVYRAGEVWIIYTDGTDILFRTSLNAGASWSAPTVIDSYLGVDTLHAVRGADNGIYVQYQKSTDKETYIMAYQGGDWNGPVQPNIMGMTTQPWSCDFGIKSDGTLLDMWTGSWSMFGFHSTSPYDINTFTLDNIQSFYNAVYSINDGFVQLVDVPKMFYIHDDYTIDFAWYAEESPGVFTWFKLAAYTSPGRLIEPAVAPESNLPYHLVIAKETGGTYEVAYYRFNALPPDLPHVVILEGGLTTEPVFHSISYEDGTVSILYDADDEVRYVESSNGGDTFSDSVVLGSGGVGVYKYSHVRNDPFSTDLIAAYAKEETGDYNIYIQKRTN